MTKIQELIKQSDDNFTNFKSEIEKIVNEHKAAAETDTAETPTTEQQTAAEE